MTLQSKQIPLDRRFLWILSGFTGAVAGVMILFFWWIIFFYGNIQNIKNNSQKIASKPVKTEEKNLKPKNELYIPILLYHYVEIVQDQNDTIRQSLDITPNEFERQVKEFVEGKYQTYFVKDIPELISGTKKYNPKSVILTFDDGYLDFYTNVFPILKKYRIRATLFVINKFIGRKDFVTYDHIIELSQSGLVEIASHTLSHVNLIEIDEKTAIREIVDSKTDLEQIIGKKVVSFAYPYGGSNNRIQNIVTDAGFLTAVTTTQGTKIEANKMYKLSRIRGGVLLERNVIKTLDSYINQDK